MKHQPDYIISRIANVNILNLEDIGCEYLRGEITYYECIEKMQERIDKAYREAIDKLKSDADLYYNKFVDVKDVGYDE